MELALVIAVYLVAIFSLSILFLKLTYRLRESREQQVCEQLRREHPERVFGTDEYLARFDHPDISALETHLNRPLPQELKKLYADPAIMRSESPIVIPSDSTEPDDDHRVLYFFPADGLAIEDLWPEEGLASHQVPFAADGNGGVYYVELGASDEADSPVFLYHYDGDVYSEVAHSLSEFLSWRTRTPHP